MSQNNQILTALQRGERLTPMDALRQFGCFRLAARIKDLRDDGHNIVTHRVEAGANRQVASYVLLPDA